MTWRQALELPRYRYLLIYVVVSAVVFFVLMPSYFAFIETRAGTLLYDPLLAILPAQDVSLAVFLLIHGAVWSTAIINRKNPHVILLALSSYCTVNYLRAVTMYLFTLEPPANWVIMHDPIVSLIAYEPTFAKDLFFSGHISTLMVTVLPEPNITFRRIKIAATVLLALLLLIQHIHYTIDVAAAPVFTYLSYKFMQRFLQQKH